MSLSRDQMTALMALADGELDGDALAEVEALVATNDDARRVLEAMRGPAVAAVGEWVAESQIERAVAAQADSVAGSVMDAIEKTGGAKVTSLDAARNRRDARMKAAALVVVAGSIAAGVFFFFGTDKVAPPAPVASNVAPPPVVVPMPSPSALASAEPALVDDPSPGPEITVESTTSHDVSVFRVPASIGAAVNTPGSVIVWIGDDQPEGKK